MSVFEYVTGAILLILGLAVTQLLTDVVNAFRRRQTTPLQWVPMTWAAVIFAWQMQFLWAVFELHTLVDAWTAGQFLLMLVLTLLLFVAGALVVPSATDETVDGWEQFQRDGRWSLAVLAAFFFLAYFVNVALFDIGYVATANLQDLGLGAFLLVTLFARSRTAWARLTLAFAAWSAVAIVLLSPAFYS